MASAAHDTNSHHDAHDDYDKGTMEIGEQRSTYDVFMSLTKWGSLAVAAVVVWSTLAFAAGVGGFAALIPTAVLVGAGIFFLREKKQKADPANRHP